MSQVKARKERIQSDFIVQPCESKNVGRYPKNAQASPQRRLERTRPATSDFIDSNYTIKLNDAKERRHRRCKTC